MVNNDYLVDMSWCDSGGQSDFMPIKGEDHLGFKSFKKKTKAQESFDNQVKLSKFDLAPKVVTGICKIPYGYNLSLFKDHIPEQTHTSWGYVTEKASLLDIDKIPYNKIQKLVDSIKENLSMKFWDSHVDNVGYIKRGRKKILVCIDTGAESFCGYCNAWGFEEPGPKCPYCNKYQCKCSTVYDCVEENYNALY